MFKKTPNNKNKTQKELNKKKTNPQIQPPKFHCPQQISLSSGSSHFAFWYPFNIDINTDSFNTGNYRKFCHI